MPTVYIHVCHVLQYTICCFVSYSFEPQTVASIIDYIVTTLTYFEVAKESAGLGYPAFDIEAYHTAVANHLSLGQFILRMGFQACREKAR